MIKYIFRRENHYDLERIEVEVVSFQSHSIKIKQGKEVVTLSWDGEYEYPALCIDDILLLYINGKDFSKGYILPIAQGCNSGAFDTSLIIKSELDKLKQGHKKELNAMAEILKNVIEYYSGRSIDDYTFFLDVLRSSSTENESFEQLRRLVNEQKEKATSNERLNSDKISKEIRTSLSKYDLTPKSSAKIQPVRAKWKDSIRNPMTYTTENLIEDLIRDLQKHSEELYKIFPERLDRFKLTHLSKLLGKSSGNLARHLQIYREKKNYYLSNKVLEGYKTVVKQALEPKSKRSIEIIERYGNGEISLPKFLESLRVEVGRVSGLIELTYDEINSIFGFLVDDLLQRIQNDNRKYHNPDYKFSEEVLDDLIDNLNILFTDKIDDVIGFINKYRLINKDLKKYSLEQHNVKNPNYFKTIKAGDFLKAYLFGLLYSDGYLLSAANTYGIGLELNAHDVSLLNLLKDSVGIENEIKERYIFKNYKGEIKRYKQVRLRFACKPMYNDLKNLGIVPRKTFIIKVPDFVKLLIADAKKYACKEVDWYDHPAGQTALAFLLGYFDGDGSYMKTLGYPNSDAGVIYSANREFLQEVKVLFGINHEIKTKDVKGDKTQVFDEDLLSKGYWYLIIDKSPVNILYKMLKSYNGGLLRKRPQNHS